MESQVITNTHKSIIINALRDQSPRIKKIDIAKACGEKSSAWVSQLLTPLEKGGMKTISESDANAIEGLLGVSLLEVEDKILSEEEAFKKEAASNPHIKAIEQHLLALYRDNNSDGYSLPFIPTEDLVAFGEEIVRAAHEDPDKPGKVGRIGIVWLAQCIDRLSSEENQIECSYSIPMRGCIAAGSAIYTEEISESICVNKKYPSDHFALQVCGDSGEHDQSEHKRLPSILDGSTIILRKMSQGEAPKSGKLYAVSDGNGAMLKLIKGKKLGSLNPEYDDFKPLEDAVVQAEFVEVLA